MHKLPLPSCETSGFRENRTCAYCGSVHPDDFMNAVKEGLTELGPTDKSYKVYVTNLPSIKFYFNHLSEEQMKQFVDLYNYKMIKYQGDSGFYTLPYFMRLK